MIRRSTHTLKFATFSKKQNLKDFFEEYTRLVNTFIELYWDAHSLPQKANSVIYTQIASWMMGKARKCAVNQAMRIIKSTRKKDRQKTYKAYQRAYAKAKKKNRDIFGILSSKWSQWSKGKTFRHRISIPRFSGNTIDLNSDLVTMKEANKAKSFDVWLRLGSIFGNRSSLILPVKHHRRSRKFEKNGWEQRKSITLRRDSCNQYYVDIYWHKEAEQPDKNGKVVGVDVGIQKLATCSNGEQLGKDIRSKLDKLNRRKQGSKNWHKTCKEIKDYIGYAVNRFPWNDVDVVVMENISNITHNTKGKLNKTVRKLLGNWNIELIYRRMRDKAEESRTFLAYVEPSYSSVECSSCRTIDKKSRNGEEFKCTNCGSIKDADYNASLNILQRFLNGEFTVSRGT